MYNFIIAGCMELTVKIASVRMMVVQNLNPKEYKGVFRRLHVHIAFLRCQPLLYVAVCIRIHIVLYI